MKRTLTAILSLAFLLLAGCLPEKTVSSGPISEATGTSENPLPPSVELPFETIDQGIRSGIRDARKVVVRDPETWRNLWAEHVKGQIPEPSLPLMNFGQEMVIAFFLGEKLTGGYTVRITKIAQVEEGITVQVQVDCPPPGVFLPQVLTQPFHIVKVLRFDLPIEFVVKLTSVKG